MQIIPFHLPRDCSLIQNIIPKLLIEYRQTIMRVNLFCFREGQRLPSNHLQHFLSEAICSTLKVCAKPAPSKEAYENICLRLFPKAVTGLNLLHTIMPTLGKCGHREGFIQKRYVILVYQHLTCEWLKVMSLKCSAFCIINSLCVS